MAVSDIAYPANVLPHVSMMCGYFAHISFLEFRRCHSPPCFYRKAYRKALLDGCSATLVLCFCVARTYDELPCPALIIAMFVSVGVAHVRPTVVGSPAGIPGEHVWRCPPTGLTLEAFE